MSSQSTCARIKTAKGKEFIHFYIQEDEGDRRCHFDRRGYNPGSDKCQVCSATNGLYGKESDIPKDSPFYQENEKGKVIGFFREDFKGCPDHMPESDS